jgi:hypothetical protein
VRAFQSGIVARGLPSSAAMNAIYVMTDHTGSWPTVWGRALPPRSLPGRRTWRLAAVVGDDQIVPTLITPLRKCEAGEL